MTKEMTEGFVPKEWLQELYRQTLGHYVQGFTESPCLENWIIFTSGGIKEEGKPHPKDSFFNTPEEAWKAYCKKLIELLQSLPSIRSSKLLIWRTSPELRYNEETTKWAVYSRFNVPVDYFGDPV